MARRRFLLRLVGPRFLKRWLPTTLFGRSLLIIVLPMGLTQLIVSLLLFNAHSETVTSRLTHAVAGDVAWTVSAWKQDHSPAAMERLQALAEKSQGLSVTFKAQPLPTSNRANLFASLDRSLKGALEDDLDGPFWFDTTRYPNYVDIRAKVQGGSLIFIAPRDHVFAPLGWIFFLVVPGSTLLLTLVSVLFIRNQIRAIERLADAANTFGRGGDVSEFKPHGAREVRDAANAFITMKDNIQRHLDQRTALLASVSHDLRTPLTRLNLELALADPSNRTKAMKSDLAEMEYMIDEYLDFARGVGASEELRRMPLLPLLEEVAENARRAGAQVTIEGDPAVTAPIRPRALRRILANLVGNAAAHGEHIRLAMQKGLHLIDILVDDDGPGIAPEHYEDAFKPFNRLDESRNQNAKGVGLGLAIARDVARGHGGEVLLDASPMGGLRAIVRLPA